MRSVENISRKEHPHRDLSTTLLRSSGRDDKGEGGASIECGCRTKPIFHHLEWAKAHNFSGRDDKGKTGGAHGQWLLNRSRFSNTWGGPRAHDSSVEKRSCKPPDQVSLLRPDPA
jgi:hypothetical protein